MLGPWSRKLLFTGRRRVGGQRIADNKRLGAREALSTLHEYVVARHQQMDRAHMKETVTGQLDGQVAQENIIMRVCKQQKA